MKKLFFFMSIALMVIATSCKKDSKSSPVVPFNSGNENIAYSYYIKTNNLCGQGKKDVIKYLKEMNMTQKSATEYTYKEKDYAVEISFADNDDNDAVDIVTVTLHPSEVPGHENIFNYKYVLGLANAIGSECKMLNENIACRFRGFYSEDKGEWMSKNFDGFVNGNDVAAKYLGSGSAYWLDNTIEQYEPTEKEAFTGMILTPVQLMDDTKNPIDEYTITLTFAFKQVL